MWSKHKLAIPYLGRSRNVDPTAGMCNEARLTITIIGGYVLEGKVRTHCKIGDKSLKQVDIYLPKAIFSHGQLYVAISIVTSKNNLCINSTLNVMFKEVRKMMTLKLYVVIESVSKQSRTSASSFSSLNNKEVEKIKKIP
ncbi:hypothetical protein MTR_3g035990 [Medicago truncatula]|uniref:Uncharacterized protein n=1 Tax=Medicago truncatula TaxID=3880 RepID=G7J123_MEDTR|nr:hypothetical protein MTR_3g035990 [Medicago truncatula]